MNIASEPENRPVMSGADGSIKMTDHIVCRPLRRSSTGYSETSPSSTESWLEARWELFVFRTALTASITQKIRLVLCQGFVQCWLRYLNEFPSRLRGCPRIARGARVLGLWL